MTVPYSFGTATSAIPLSQLDANFNTPITLGNTAIQLGNTVTTLNNMTLANVTISSGNVTITNVSVTTANVTTVNATTIIATTANVTTGNVTNLISGNVALTGGAINGTTLGATTAASANVTTLTTSSTVTLNGGTANAVAYLNTSKVLTTGSALTFDGTNFVVGASAAFTVGTATLVQSQAVGGSGYVAARYSANASEAVVNFGKSRSGVNATLGGAVVSGDRLGGLQFYGDDGTSWIQGAKFWAEVNGTVSTGSVPSNFVWSLSGSEQMRLTSTGLGIGTTSPQAKFVVSKAGAEGLEFFPGDSSNLSRILAYNRSGATRNDFQLDGTTLQFLTGGTERVRIDSSGNLLVLGGLGNTGGGKIEVVSNATSAITTRSASSGANTTVKAVRSVDSGASDFANAQYDALSHAWILSNSTQAMTLDASGNLGVGDTSPGSKANFIVYGAPVSYAGLNATAVLSSSTAQTTGVGGLMAFEGQYGSGLACYGAIGGLKENSTSGNYAGYLAFYTRSNGSLPAERARITSGGYFKASNNGTYRNSTAGYHELRSNDSGNATAFFTNSSATTPSGVTIGFTAAAPNDATQYFVFCEDNAATRAVIRSNGGIANYQANDVNLSDRREKTNFAPAKSYLDTICAIPVQTFEYIDQSKDDPGLTLGVVAQDVQAVAPELVMESNWGTEEEPKMRLSIYQTDLQYALMKCIQELKAEVDSLKAQLKGA